MRTKTVVLLACIAVFSVTAVAGDLAVRQDGDDRRVLLTEDAVFELNTSLSGNFTISLYNTSTDAVVANASMTLVENETYDRYQYNRTIDAANLSHDMSAVVWREPRGTPYIIAERDLHVAVDAPSVFEVETLPSFKEEGEAVTVRANVSDAADDIDTVTLSFNGSDVGMNDVRSFEGFGTYSGSFTPAAAGMYDYSIEAEDAGGLLDVFEAAFRVFEAPRSQGTTVNVTTVRGCFPVIETFEAPGSPTPVGLNLLAINTTDNMTLELANEGGYNFNASVQMNVTAEDDEWIPPEPFGNLSELYPYQNVTLPYLPGSEIEANDTLTNPFSSENRTGFFTARFEANYTCYEGNDTRGSGELAGYDNFFIGKAGGGDQGGDEEALGPGGENETITFGGDEQNGTVSFDGTNVTISFNGTNISIGVSEDNISFGGDLEEIDFGGDNPLAGPGGDEPQYGGGGDEPRYGGGGDEPQFGEGGQQPEFGEGGQQPEFGPGGEQAQAQPILSVSMRPLNTSYETIRRRFGRVAFEIENEGGIPVEDLRVRPRIGSFDGTWEVQPANVANLSDGEAVNRSVFIRPDEDVPPGMYQVPLLATGGGNETELAVQYVPFRVRPEVFESRINITEVPRTIRVERNASTTIPVLLNNAGATNLTNISAELQNVDGVGAARGAVIDRMDVNGSTALRIQFNATDAVTSTNATLIVSTEEGAYSFADIGIEVTPERGIVPPEFRLPLVAIIWTVLLVIYALVTKFYNLDSLMVRIPFVLLILGEVTIMLYVATEYYGLSSPLLPF